MNHIVVSTLAHPNIDNLLEAYPSNNIFYFENGEYSLTATLTINRPGIRFCSVSGNPDDVKIVQTSFSDNAINIQYSNFTMDSISVVHDEGEGMCLYQGDANWTNIENCKFYGNATNHTVFFAGPAYASLDDLVLLFNNEQFNSFNNFDNNIIYTKTGGTSITYNLQQHGCIKNNIIRGGKVSSYMMNNCVINHNFIYESGSNGISITGLMKNVNVFQNLIKKTETSSINIKLTDDLLLHRDLCTNIIIDNNSIKDCKYISIELNKINNITIKNNNIKWTTDLGIFMVDCNNITINDNDLIQYRRGVHVDIDSHAIEINNNNFYSVFPKISEHSIAIEDLTHTINVVNNTIYGMHLSSVTKDVTGANIFSGNTVNDNIAFNDEIIKLS